MKKAFVFLANGFEEIEALATVDILRRAGITTTTVSITSSLQVTGAHGVEVKADTIFSDNKYSKNDWLITPGGMPGASNLAACEPLTTLLKEHHAQGGNIAAICASPAVVLSPLGILEGKEATCYPGCEDFFPGFSFLPDGVVVSGNIVTAKSVGYAFDLALKLIEMLAGLDVSNKVRNQIYYKV